MRRHERQISSNKSINLSAHEISFKIKHDKIKEHNCFLNGWELQNFKYVLKMYSIKWQRRTRTCIKSIETCKTTKMFNFYVLIEIR